MTKNKRKKFIHMLEPDDYEERETRLEIFLHDNSSRNEKEIAVKKIGIEPASEIITYKNGIQIFVYLPGIRSEKLKITTEKKNLCISAHSLDCNYKKDILLQEDYDIDNKRITYKNYALEIFIPFKNNR